MGIIGIIALLANVVTALILYAFRDGDSMSNGCRYVAVMMRLVISQLFWRQWVYLVRVV